MTPPELHNEIMDLIHDADVHPHVAMSVLMKLSASIASMINMTQGDFLRAADLTYKIESFVQSDTDDLTMH
mgnify:CR=1 FL=1